MHQSALLAVLTNSKINNKLKWANFGRNRASNLKMATFNATLYFEHNGYTCAAILEILKLRDQFLTFRITLDRLYYKGVFTDAPRGRGREYETEAKILPLYLRYLL